VEAHGRHRYFRLAGPTVAEALAVIAPARPVRSLREASVPTTCPGAVGRSPDGASTGASAGYHVADALGAALAERLLDLRWIERLPGSRAVRVTPSGAKALRSELGVEL
jgi:hypothetical protein